LDEEERAHKNILSPWMNLTSQTIRSTNE